MHKIWCNNSIVQLENRIAATGGQTKGAVLSEKFGSKYTAEEDDFIRENIDRLTVAEMARKLGRTEVSVQSRRCKIGAKTQKQRKWTKEEETFLRKHRRDMSIRQIASALGRTKSSVEHKIKSLGIEKHNFREWTYNEEMLLYFPLTEEEISQKTGRSKRSVVRRMKAYGIREIKQWTKAHDEVLRRSYGKVPIGKIATVLGRFTGDIERRAKRLGVA